MTKPDVLVVGGGPVGLTMGCELLRHGVSCRLIDQNPEPQVWSKAAGVAARTMEVWHDMGIVDRALERGRPMHGVNLYNGTDRIAHLDIRIPGTPFPYLFGMSQRKTELMLAERFAELGGTFEREVRLDDINQSDDDVEVTLVHKDGRQEEVEVGWVAACDGAKSTVRKLLELPFEGSTFEQTIVQADVKAEFPFAADAHEAVAFVSDEGPVGFLPLLDEGRYRLLLMGVVDPPEEPPFELIEELVTKRCPEGVRAFDPAWTVSFRFHGRIVPRYRVGRVFLSGDAAHIHSPAGAQGMNLGIQDAYNLAWKLALTIKGATKPEILDSYHHERHPIGKNIVESTDKLTKRAMRVMTLRSPVAQALRNQAAAFVFNSGLISGSAFQTIGMLNVSYANSPIVGEHHQSIWTAEVGSDHTTERPALSEWYQFSRGPGAGERVGDCHVDDERTLFDLLRGTNHTLLLFDGNAGTQEGYCTLDSIADRVSRRYGDHIDVHVVTPSSERPQLLKWEGSLIHDLDGVMHEHFGCNSEALYLVRPDGHVGFRTQPAEESQLLRYLETIFVA